MRKVGRPPKKKPNRKDGRYEVKVKVGESFDGTKIMKSFYSSKSKEDARMKAEDYINGINSHFDTSPIYSEKSSISSFDVWSLTVLDMLKGTIKDNSWALHYKNTIENHLIPYFKSKKVYDIKQIDIQIFFNKLKSKYSLETLKKFKMVLNKIFELAIQNDIIIKNPCANIKVISSKKQIEKQTYTEEQCGLVLQYALTHRYGLDVILMLLYGVTRSELLGLQWDDFDKNEKTLHIQHGVTDTPNAETGKTEVIVGDTKNQFRNRIIPISADVVDLLKNRKKQAKVKSEYIFCNNKGNVQSPRTWSRRHYDVFMRDMHNYYAEQGIEIPKLHPHELRHTRATLWVNKGLNLYAIANVLGHSDLKMLRKRYAHENVESTREMLNINVHINVNKGKDEF
jgi:integrase